MDPRLARQISCPECLRGLEDWNPTAEFGRQMSKTLNYWNGHRWVVLKEAPNARVT
jgi:hypothetical protein